MIRAYQSNDPTQKFQLNPFSPPPFVQIPDEPRELNKLAFAPRTSLLPLKNIWKIRDMVNITP